MSADIKVIYIMSLWRSGSTVLDIILSNHECLEGVGELRQWPKSFRTGKGTCSCGNKANRCEYWEAVNHKWMQKVGDSNLERLAAIQDRYDRMRSLPRLLLETFWPSSDFGEYRKLVIALYESIQEVSGKDIIVDSSKYPARAYALLKTRCVDLSLVHLVRDGRAVVWSCKKKPNVDVEGTMLQPNDSTVTSNTIRQWLWFNLTGQLITCLARVKAVRIRYEDFVVDPAGQLKKIGEISGIEFNQLSDAVASGQTLEIGHMIAGNRVRMQGAVRLKADLDWIDKLPQADRKLFWRQAGWLAKIYGYQKD